MFLGSNSVVDQILSSFFLALFAITGIAGLVLGISLNLDSTRTLGFLKSMNRWISFRGKLAALDKPYAIEPTVYKQSRWFAIAFVICGAYTVYMLLFSVEFPAVVAAFGKSAPPVVVELLVGSMKWLLVLGGVAAIVIGLTMFGSRRILPKFSSSVDRWYDSSKVDDFSNQMNLTLDNWVEAFPRTAGLLLLLGSAVVLIAATMVWLAR